MFSTPSQRQNVSLLIIGTIADSMLNQPTILVLSFLPHRRLLRYIQFIAIAKTISGKVFNIGHALKKQLSFNRLTR